MRPWIWICIVIAVMFGGAGYVYFSQPSGYVLITEAQYEQHSSQSARRTVQIMEKAGPAIVFHSPTKFPSSSPIDFDVEFKARNGVSPDLNTLKVEYSLGIMWADITPRLMGHAKISGTRMRSENAEVPAGRHTIRISIADKDNRVSTAILKMTVK